MDLEKREQLNNLYYEAGNSIQALFDELLLPFELFSNQAVDDLKADDDFFLKFFTYADKFIGNSCENIATWLREKTLVAGVRGTPTVTLASQIRQNVFTPLDNILNNFAVVAKEIGIKIEQANTVTGAATGAIIGQIISGAKGINVNTVVGAVVGYAVQASKIEDLKNKARIALFISIYNFLEESRKVPESLLDYCISLCVGDVVDFELQRNVLNILKANVDNKIDNSTDIINNFISLRQQKKSQPLNHFGTDSGDRQRKKRNIKIFFAVAIFLLVISLIAQVIEKPNQPINNNELGSNTDKEYIDEENIIRAIKTKLREEEIKAKGKSIFETSNYRFTQESSRNYKITFDIYVGNDYFAKGIVDYDINTGNMLLDMKAEESSTSSEGD